jgi:hypothetical protein
MAILNENLCQVPLADECFILHSFTFHLKTTVIFSDNHCDGVFVSTSQICRTWPLKQNFMLQLCYLTLNADYIVVVKKAINLYCLFFPLSQKILKNYTVNIYRDLKVMKRQHIYHFCMWGLSS